jgi:hypothetical protein
LGLSTIAKRSQNGGTPTDRDNLDNEESDEGPTEILDLMREAPSKGKPKKKTLTAETQPLPRCTDIREEPEEVH